MKPITPINLTAHQVGIIYDNLIKLATKNLGKKIKMDWGHWTPSKLGLDTLISRRIKLKYNR